MNRKIVAIDFDGTLCENKYPLIGKPKPHVINYVKGLKSQGHSLILWTCRAGEYLSDAVAWCSEQGIELDYVNENTPEMVEAFKNDCRKIFADVYLDDRAINVKDLEEMK